MLDGSSFLHLGTLPPSAGLVSREILFRADQYNPKAHLKSPTPAERARALCEVLPRIYPGAHCELNFSSPLELLIATILSAQCTDVQVNKVTASLFQKYRTARDYAEADPAQLEHDLRAIGLYRNKAKNVIALSRILLDKYGGEVPLTRAGLIELPGVGNKTASVVLNELNIEPAIAVDTHVFRVSHRLGLVDAKANTPEKVERELMRVIPKPWLTRAHHWLILHGRYVCVARKPKCGVCPLADLCPSHEDFAGAG